MELLEWFFVAVLLILLCLAYSPLFISLFEVLSPIFEWVAGWFKRPNVQQVKEEEARQLECEREKKRLMDDFIEKRKEDRKQKIQNMLIDGSLGELDKPVDEILRASEELMGHRVESAHTMIETMIEGRSMEKIMKEKRKVDELVLIAVSKKSGIDVNLLKRIVENLEDLDSDERDGGD